MEILLGETETDLITGTGARYHVLGIVSAINPNIVEELKDIHNIDESINLQTNNNGINIEITELFIGDLDRDDELVEIAYKIKELLNEKYQFSVKLNTTKLFFDHPEENLLEIHSQD